jgi:hypothetical protein
LTKCESCEEEIKDNEWGCSEEHTICQSCESDDRMEPCAWVHHLLESNDENNKEIGQYFNDTDGEFELNYVHTDGWRGHYEVTSKNYTMVHDDCNLAYSEDSQNLEQFDDMIKKLARKHKIGIVRVITRTSNLFSQNVDYFVHNSHLDKWNRIIDQINRVKNNLRDPTEFTRTAIFGE